MSMLAAPLTDEDIDVVCFAIVGRYQMSFPEEASLARRLVRAGAEATEQKSKDLARTAMEV